MDITDLYTCTLRPRGRTNQCEAHAYMFLENYFCQGGECLQLTIMCNYRAIIILTQPQKGSLLCVHLFQENPSHCLQLAVK